MVSFNLSKRKLLLSVSKLQLILLLCTVIPHNLSAQGFIETGYTPQRNLLDKDDLSSTYKCNFLGADNKQ